MDRKKKVRTSEDRDDPGGHKRLAVIEGWGYTRPCRAEMKTFYFVYSAILISVSYTLKYL